LNKRLRALKRWTRASMPSSFATSTDGALARGEERPLLGIPRDAEGAVQRCRVADDLGFSKVQDFVPTEDALTVSRLKQAGPLIIGKTNIPVGLREFQSYNDIYGATNNPRALPVGCRSRVSQDHSQPPGGISKTGSSAIVPGLANAIHAATGKRPRQVPSILACLLKKKYEPQSTARAAQKPWLSQKFAKEETVT
jgi:Asp-tRNA(Asn)/Glu-tRNA(Gln) amidotransferase A subunit family amidase